MENLYNFCDRNPTKIIRGIIPLILYCVICPQDIVDGLPSLEQDAVINVQLQFADGGKKLHSKTVKTSKKLSRLEKKKLSYEDILKDVAAGSCCSRRCIQSILTVDDIYKTRERFLKKSRESQAQYLLSFFKIARRSKGQKTVYIHAVENKDVCLKAWTFSYGISYGRFVPHCNSCAFDKLRIYA